MGTAVPNPSGVRGERPIHPKLTQHLKIGALVVLAILALYFVFGLTPEVWPNEYGAKADDVHWKLGMATGTAALLLLAGTLSVTPILRIRGNGGRRVHIPVRRALGVWTTSISMIHGALGLTLHSQGGNSTVHTSRSSVGRVSVAFSVLRYGSPVQRSLFSSYWRSSPTNQRCNVSASDDGSGSSVSCTPLLASSYSTSSVFNGGKAATGLSSWRPGSFR